MKNALNAPITMNPNLFSYLFIDYKSKQIFLGTTSVEWKFHNAKK